MKRFRRVRHLGYGARAQYGRFSVAFDVHAYAVPLPRVRVYFDEAEVALALSIGDLHSDPIIACSIAVELPGNVADALVVVWPGRVAPGERRAALSRLLHEAAAALDATPAGVPAVREDP